MFALSNANGTAQREQCRLYSHLFCCFSRRLCILLSNIIDYSQLPRILLSPLFRGWQGTNNTGGFQEEVDVECPMPWDGLLQIACPFVFVLNQGILNSLVSEAAGSRREGKQIFNRVDKFSRPGPVCMGKGFSTLGLNATQRFGTLVVNN